MPVISVRKDYDGFQAKVERLGLDKDIIDAESTLSSFSLSVAEERHANGTKWLRERIDYGFEALTDWMKISSGGIDWTKTGSAGLSVGVEVQVSGRSDMLAVDVLHLSKSLEQGTIDVGLIMVPDDDLSRFLTDRTPNLSTAERHVNHWGAALPIRIVAFRHDGVGPALPKMRTNLGRSR